MAHERSPRVGLLLSCMDEKLYKIWCDHQKAEPCPELPIAIAAVRSDKIHLCMDLVLMSMVCYLQQAVWCAGTMPATGCESRRHWHSGHSSPWLQPSMPSGKPAATLSCTSKTTKACIFVIGALTPKSSLAALHCTIVNQAICPAFKLSC